MSRALLVAARWPRFDSAREYADQTLAAGAFDETREADSGEGRWLARVPRARRFADGTSCGVPAEPDDAGPARDFDGK